MSVVRKQKKMSDTYISIVSEKLNVANSQNTAEKIVKFLTEQKISQRNLTDCVLSLSHGHKPAENHQNALKNPKLDFTELKTNGIELITEKQVFHNGGNGLDEVNCPYCGENNIENDWGNSLDNWYNGTDSDKVKCFNCNTVNIITKFEFKPTWAFGNFGITFWNWTELTPQFVTELEKIIGTDLKCVTGKI